jgi:CubicO group peptidase (beta-lactamase class C family)
MRVIFLAALLAVPGTLAAQQRDITPIVDRVFSSWNSTTSPGCAVGVARGADVLLTRGYGMADLETGRPITEATIFETGSVAKQFTATAVVLLALDGKLSLDDPVRKLIPELPDYGQPLTIRHLLTHTSGLREWSTLVSLQGWPRGSRVHKQSDLLDIVTRQRTLNHKPGEFYSYTNSGYGLLFTLVERASGQTFAKFTTDRIFTPLGMSNTRWRDDFTRVVPGRAQAYDRQPDGWHLEMPFENVVGPGGLLSTVGDLLKWNAALANKTLGGGAAVVDSLSRRPRLTGVGGRGRESEYAFGLSFTSYRGVPEVSHGGATAGYRTFLARYPTQGELSIAVMCNAGNANAGSYAHQIADSVIAFPAVALDTVALDTVRFARLVGGYRNTRTHEPLLIRRAQAAQYRSFRDGSLYFINGRLRILLDSTPRGARSISADDDTVQWRYAGDGPWAPTAAQLQAFAGEYRSDELGITYRVADVNDTLTVSPRPGVVEKLRPTYPDGFGGFGGIWFERDRRGRVTALHFSQSRVWDLVVPKVR